MRNFITIFTLIFCFSTYTIADSSSNTVLVTGSTGAFGEAISSSLASEGYNLLITGRNEKKLKSLKNKLQTKYPSTKVETLKIDFSDFKTIKAAANKTDGVSLKAVVLIGPRPSLRKNGFPSTEEWSEEFKKTFIAPLEVLRTFGEKIENNGSIVIISGSSSKNYLPNYQNTNVLRLAWIGEVKNLVQFFAVRKIRVNAVSPGIILTEYHKKRIEEKAKLNNTTFQAQLSLDTAAIPLRSYGHTDDVANLISFLLSDKSAHLNGSNILLDGGESTAY
ncbi:MAG: SDR family oxidoreductase [Rickettsia endosymbiont of Labidopullus appendiculatus]|nr:SDR family oxidoreductase [Rickettsia endosymbiont of Labidopullus appendiculatus]